MFDVVVSLPERKESKFGSILVRMAENKELLFKGRVRFLLSEEHSELIEQIEDSKCVFSQRIVFRGPLTLLAGKVIRDSYTGLRNMNDELKKCCEKSE